MSAGVRRAWVFFKDLRYSSAKSSLGPTGPRSKGGTNEIPVSILRRGNLSFLIFSWGRHFLPSEVPGDIVVWMRARGRKVQRPEGRCHWGC